MLQILHYVESELTIFPKNNGCNRHSYRGEQAAHFGPRWLRGVSQIALFLQWNIVRVY